MQASPLSAQAEEVKQAESGQEGRAVLIKAHHPTPNQVFLPHMFSFFKWRAVTAAVPDILCLSSV